MKNINTGIIIVDMTKNICIRSTEAASSICVEGEQVPGRISKLIYGAGNKSETTVEERDYLLEYSHSTDEGYSTFTVADITELNRMELENRILNKSIEYVQDAVYAIDREGRELVLNRIERFMPAYREKLVREMMEVFETGQAVLGNYNKYITLDHKEIHMLSTLVPVKDGDEVIAVLLINRYLNRIQETLSRVQNLQLKNRISGNAKLPDNNTSYTFEDIIGESKSLVEVKERAMKASSSNIPILIQGETGTGKELFAQSIHNASPNSREPFLAINCAAIPGTLLESILFGTKKGIYTGAENTEGLMEQAGEGTLFLDEINSMSMDLQAKLLRSLQEKKVRRLGSGKEIPINCRIISSVNEDPEKLISDGRLRKDFFYRIAALTLVVPPLRDRERDILRLSNFFIEKFSRIYGKFVTGMSPQLEELFMLHKWPGNIRELEHVIESSFNFIDNETYLTTRNLPNYFQIKANEDKFSEQRDIMNTSNMEMRTDSLPQLLNEIEKGVIMSTLKKNGGNITKSAEKLGIKRQNLQSRMNKLKISKSIVFDRED
ncbi:arginine utilization regulatory protein [Dethiosulfatibacter aminovorans DSM 17477]|uniref:Arginine utilization regulatory protein n=1 Tax=Dethiosulfatibacter aminovorans DSM 17477 TaxID=1121476 RepID=A0A1M6AAK9_9FIRM|nr:sigma 54-interacting transcriptional regulator [Dethiosulfatibacter aminovorans]SHI33554.1 arginine utilization regulatory protein [Dethiosulfatibacter aminovorans DSM 17477]